MYEFLLNGILHLFAIFAALNPEKRRAARDLVEEHVQRTLGIARGDVYVGLFEGFLDLYVDAADPDLVRENLKTLCENLREKLSRLEQYIALLRVMELVRLLAGDSRRAEGLMSMAAAAFSVPEDSRDDLLRLVFAPDRFDSLSRNFLVVGFAADRREAPRTLNREHFHGGLVILRIAEIDSLFLTPLQEGISVDENPLPARRIHLLDRGCLIRDIYRNALYHTEIERAFSDEAFAGPPLAFRGETIEFRFPRSDAGLHNFSFEAQTGSMIGVMGGSGVGKSTLLGILNGTLRPDSGTITVNGLDLYRRQEELDGVIGYVPQDDLLFGDLTVYENLYYNAKLCLANLSEDRIRERVRKTLEDLNSYEIRDLKVGTPTDKMISGGQRKRLNIALELIREPPILFVDEPTSGLSSSDSENVMGLLKFQASRGRLVIVIIHQPSSNVFKMFDSLWILDMGGYPIFAGNPIDAIRHFRETVNIAGAEQVGCPLCGSVNPEQILNLVESKRMDETGRFTRERKYAPRFWHERYLALRKERMDREAEAPQEPPEKSLFKPSRRGQMLLFLKRNIRTKLANRQYLAINLLEAPLMGLIVAGIVRLSQYGPYRFGENKYLPIFYFMSVIVALFLGLSVSAEEIVRDRAVLKREQFLNLSWLSYWSSKFFYLCGLAALQMSLYILVSVAILDIPDMSARMFAVLFSCAAFACMLGLNVSSAFKTAVTIYILIPLLLIPQILLCGIVIRFDDIKSASAGNNSVPWIGEIMASRWGLEALVVEQYRSNRYQHPFDETEGEISRASFVAEQLIPEIRAKMDFFFLKTDMPDREPKRRQYLRIVRNEIRALERGTGLLSDLHDEVFQPEKWMRGDAAKASAFLGSVAEFMAGKKSRAVKKRSEINDGLVRRYGGEGFKTLREKHHNAAVEILVRNREELEALRVSGERLVQLSDPVYQLPASRWGKAVFWAAEKQWSSWRLGAFAFNLAVLWMMTALLGLLLHLRALQRVMRC